MTVFLGPKGTFVMGTKAKPITEAQYRDAWCAPASPLSWRTETRLFHARLSTYSIRNGHQTTTVTTTSHRSREMTVSLGPHGTLVTGMKVVGRIGLCFMDNQGTHVVVTNGDHFSFHGHALTSPSASATNTSSLTAMPSQWTTTTWFWE
jgi:hypothetical protein